jgi:hypothetical protein
MELMDMPLDILGLIKSMTFVSYYSEEADLGDYNDPLIRWYHNRLRNYFYNRFSEVCREVASISCRIK